MSWGWRPCRPALSWVLRGLVKGTWGHWARWHLDPVPRGLGGCKRAGAVSWSLWEAVFMLVSLHAGDRLAESLRLATQGGALISRSPPQRQLSSWDFQNMRSRGRKCPHGWPEGPRWQPPGPVLHWLQLLAGEVRVGTLALATSWRPAHHAGAWPSALPARLAPLAPPTRPSLGSRGPSVSRPGEAAVGTWDVCRLCPEPAWG